MFGADRLLHKEIIFFVVQFPFFLKSLFSKLKSDGCLDDETGELFLCYLLTDITFFVLLFSFRWTEDCDALGLKTILLSSILVHQIRFHRCRQCELINMLL